MANANSGLSLEVRCLPSAPAEVRHALAESVDVGEALADVVLVTSELVTNAVRHSGCGPEDRLEVEVVRGPCAVRVNVADPGASGQAAAPRTPSPGSGGFGLRLVQRLARRWGSERRSGRHLVWAEISIAR